MIRRAAASVALAAVAALALPAAPASACSMPAGWFDVDTHPVPAGARIRLTGEVMADASGRIPMCETPIAPVPPTAEPTGTASPEPSVTASGDPTIAPAGPGVTLPPLVPVAFAGGGAVVVSIAYEPEPWTVEPARKIGTLAAEPRKPSGTEGLYEYTFSGRVTIPRDLKPGRYRLSAYQPDGVSWGYNPIDVVAGLPDTGGETLPLVRLAVVSLLAGAGAMAVARRVRRA